MTHLPYIVAAYAVAIGIPLYLAVSAAWRMTMASRRLAAIDPRRRRNAGA